MYRIGESIEATIEELATIEALEVGKAINQAREEMGYSAELWRYAAGQARGLEGETYNDLGTNTLGLVLREPAGVVGIITPWNFPLLIGSERVPWAIGAGCTVVIKPSEFTSGSTIRMAELAREAGLPDGVLNVVTVMARMSVRSLRNTPMSMPSISPARQSRSRSSRLLGPRLKCPRRRRHRPG
jgi:acyl-CoA reductase-like NAD-dependent aldehyde dehydrogenase